jgi:hypothetical protein
MKDKQSFIRQIALQNQSSPEGEKILWSRHGIMALVDEGWSRGLVEEALQSSQVFGDRVQAISRGVGK